jgi:FHS family L-fucose permease-like MFS transporter
MHVDQDHRSGNSRFASLLVMSIAGGAIMPYFMGWIADVCGIAVALSVPVACFAVVAGYAWKLCRSP